jgi:hypothetical protein
MSGSIKLVSGSIRNPDEADALDVELSISDAEITMRAEGTELGNWPSGAVEIRPIDSTSFEFIAEGDRLIFVPDDPAIFRDGVLGGGRAASTSSRKWRRPKRKPRDREPRLTRERASTEERSRLGRRSAAQDAPKKKPPKATRQDRKASAETSRAEVASIPPTAGSIPVATTSEGEQPAVDASPARARRKSKLTFSSLRRKRAVQGPELGETPSKGSKDKRNGVWIRALDAARDHDIFGLGRVPVDESLRGREHQHTWDHGVAASYGPGKHICTICGKIKL